MRLFTLKSKIIHFLWKNIVSKMCWQKFNYYPCTMSSTIQNRNQTKMSYVIVLFMSYYFSVHGQKLLFQMLGFFWMLLRVLILALSDLFSLIFCIYEVFWVKQIILCYGLFDCILSPVLQIIPVAWTIPYVLDNANIKKFTPSWVNGT